MPFDFLKRKYRLGGDAYEVSCEVNDESCIIRVVDTGRGFVLHSSDFFIKDATLRIDDGICLTATVDILKAIAKGAGPKHAILALGYAGWEAGQLENEIQHNGWLHCDADPDLIFGDDIDEKYLRALRKIGIDPAALLAIFAIGGDGGMPIEIAAKPAATSSDAKSSPSYETARPLTASPAPAGSSRSARRGPSSTTAPRSTRTSMTSRGSRARQACRSMWTPSAPWGACPSAAKP